MLAFDLVTKAKKFEASSYFAKALLVFFKDLFSVILSLLCVMSILFEIHFLHFFTFYILFLVRDGLRMATKRFFFFLTTKPGY